jgi:hypothetical protein
MVAVSVHQLSMMIDDQHRLNQETANCVLMWLCREGTPWSTYDCCEGYHKHVLAM